MKYTNNYKALLENTVVPQWYPYEDKTKLYSPLVYFLSSYLPVKLYRFRECNERHLCAFLNDELWFANGSKMNDDFDARLFYNKSHIIESIKAQVSDDGLLKAVLMLRSMEVVPSDISNTIPNTDKTLTYIKSLSLEQLRELSNQIIQFALNNIDTCMSKIVDSMQGMSQFASFSERVNLDVMWGVYSNNATGFALEYTFDQVSTVFFDEDLQPAISLYPIVYSNKRIDATEYANNAYLQMLFINVAAGNGIGVLPQILNKYAGFQDEFMATKIALYKSKDWKHEREWRLFYTPLVCPASTQLYSRVRFKPTAVFLGRKISDFNQRIIISIAKEKGLPVFKMESAKKYSETAVQLDPDNNVYVDAMKMFG